MRSIPRFGLLSVEPDFIAPGTEIVGFDYKLPLSDEITRGQIKAALALGLPEPLKRRSLTIIANGPSARHAPLRGSPTLGLNGSMQLFTDRGLAPTYWAACDPQAIVADFLPNDPPQETIYLIASKCHPSVFEKLKNRSVWVWHVNDHRTEGVSHIPPSSGITITSSWLMHRLGFTDFEYWGWDGCFMDGRHHASDHGDFKAGVEHMNYGGTIVDGEVIGGRTFATTRTWKAEAKGAQQFFQLAKYFDIGIKINGDGMFECERKTLMAS